MIMEFPLLTSHIPSRGISQKFSLLTSHIPSRGISQRFPLLTSHISSRGINQRKLKEKQLKMLYIAMQRNKQQTENRARLQFLPESISFDIKTEIKGRLSKRLPLTSNKRQPWVCKSTEPTKSELDFRFRQLNLCSKEVKLVSADSSRNHCIDLDIVSGVATFDDSGETNSSVKETISVTTRKSRYPSIDWSQTVKDAACTFAKDTTAHGYKHAMTGTRGKLRRMAWIMAILTVTIIMIYFTSEALLQHQAHSFTSSVKSHPAKVLPFPAVTVCNPNPWNVNIIKYAMLQYDPVTERERPIFNVSEGLGYVTVNELRDEFQLKLEDFFVSCHWDSQPFKCKDFLISTTSDTPGCFSFNWNRSTQLHVESIGPLSGLSIELEMDKFHSEGIKMVIHDQDEFPNVLDTGILVGTGNLAHIGISRNEYRFLPLPFLAYGSDHCEDIVDGSDSNKRHYYPLYKGHSACLADCRLHYILRECGCRGAQFPDVEGVPYCRVDQMYCVNEAMKKAYNHKPRFGDNLCTCALPCNKVEYSWRLSASYYNNTRVVVKVFYGDLVTRVEEHLPMYTWLSLFGTIGGNMGLLTGASVLTLMEFLDLFILFIKSSWATFRSYKQQR